jgi:hypothetical protein
MAYSYGIGDQATLLPDPNAKARNANASENQNDVYLSNNTVLAHPNPADPWVAFDYTLSNLVSKTILVVRDGRGVIVWQQELKESKGQVMWNTAATAAGNYLYTLHIGGKSAESGVVIIIH